MEEDWQQRVPLQIPGSGTKQEREHIMNKTEVVSMWRSTVVLSIAAVIAGASASCKAADATLNGLTNVAKTINDHLPTVPDSSTGASAAIEARFRKDGYYANNAKTGAAGIMSRPSVKDPVENLVCTVANGTALTLLNDAVDDQQFGSVIKWHPVEVSNGPLKGSRGYISQNNLLEH